MMSAICDGLGDQCALVRKLYGEPPYYVSLMSLFGVDGSRSNRVKSFQSRVEFEDDADCSKKKQWTLIVLY